MPLEIETLSADDHVEIEAIKAGLKDSNAGKMATRGMDLALIERHEIRLAARDGETLKGGLLGYVKYAWLYVDTLWVDPACQGGGVGSALLAEAERQAMDLGARNSWLISLTLEAPGYYPRHGYEPFAVLPEYPGEDTMTFLAKKLVR